MTEQTQCTACDAEFTPKRKSQKYCSDNCRKRKSRHAARGSRSSENARLSYEHYDRAQRLEEMIYTTAPQARLGMMKSFLGHSLHDAGLRRILTDPVLLREPPRADDRKNIAKAASAYTKKFFGVSIRTYIAQAKAGTINEDFPATRTAPRQRPSAGPRLPYVQRDAAEFLRSVLHARGVAPVAQEAIAA
jgi:hypothetical protein